MSAAVGILLLDSTGPMYSRKAVRYLLTQNTTWKRVYVFKFETDKARKDAYEKLHLEQFPVVTYTSIAAEVKKSIIRVNRSTGKPQMTVRRTAERSVKSVAIGKSSDLSFYRYSNPIETVNVDLAKQTGYYIKGDGSTMCNIGGKSLSLEGGLQQANRMAFTCNSVLGTKIDKVYVFGKQIYDSKSNKTVLKNWTLIDTLQAQIDAYLVTNTSHLYDTAFNKISNDSRKFVYYHSMATALAKIGGIQNKNSPVLKLNGLIVKHSIHNRHSYSYRTKNAKALEVCTAITGLLHDKAADFKTQTRELQEVLAEINKQYPMLDMVTATEWDEATTKSSLMTITEYINKMDV